ncbi:MAG: Crp/Fnr family transcriptional regulator [Thermomicrobiales bacterium]
MTGIDGDSAAVLRAIPLFRDLPAAAIDALLRESRQRSYPAGQVLWSEGDPGDSLLILEVGQLRISRFTGAGQEVVLQVLEAPGALGELALLDGEPRNASVTAQRAVTVRLLPRKVFRGLLREEPALVDGLLKTLAGMVRAGNARHVAAVGLDVPGRLAAWLLERAGAAPAQTGAQVRLDRSQGELAAELGTTRATLNRALKGFEALRLIESSGDMVTLLDPVELGWYTAGPAE